MTAHEHRQRRSATRLAWCRSFPTARWTLAWVAALCASMVLSPLAQAQATPAVAPYAVVGDAIPRSLTGRAGDATRGRTIVVSRQAGLCLLCHAGPFTEERFQGTIAPDLAGAGARWSEGQLRMRVVDSQRLNPATIMPSFHRVEGLTQVGAAWRNRPILTAQEVEDVVALLRTLRD